MLKVRVKDKDGADVPSQNVTGANVTAGATGKENDTKDDNVDFLISRFSVPMEFSAAESPTHSAIAVGRTR